MACGVPNCSICYPTRQAQEKLSEESKRDCIDCWRKLQKRAEAIASAPDPVTRNRRINAAYAKLWIDDRRFQWAGLAAFASKQVGCGLLNAAQMIQRAGAERQFAMRHPVLASQLATNSSNASLWAQGVNDQAAGAGAEKVYQMLAMGNATLFLDIWPIHMFYKEFGLTRLKECLLERQMLRGSIWWPPTGQVKFAEASAEVTKGFEAIDTGQINEGVAWLARHEQINILQPVIYDDPMFSTLMRANQFAWALHFSSGSTQEIQLALSNQCTSDGHVISKESFSNSPRANLAEPTQRMRFVLRAADRFDRLLHDPLERHMVENSLYIIAADGQ